MGLFVSTVSADVAIPELGIIIAHPTVDRDIGDQFTGDDVARAVSLTTAITGGSLVWRRTAGGTAENAADYDSDFLNVESEATGTGSARDRSLRAEKNSLIVKIDPGVGEFASLKAALAAASSGMIITVFPGTYVEDNSSGPVTLATGVTVKAYGHSTVSFEPQNPNLDLFLVNAENCRMQGVTIRNVTGAKALCITSSVLPAIFDFITISNCQTSVCMDASTTITQAVFRNLRLISGSTTTRLMSIVANGFACIARIYSAIITDDNGTAFTDAIYVSGTGARLDPNTALIRSTVGVGSGVQIANGANMTLVSGAEITGFNTGILNPSSGAASTIKAMSISLHDNATNDLNIQHTSTAGHLICSHARLSKIVNLSLQNFTLSYVDPITGDYNNTRVLATRGFATDLQIITASAMTTQIVSNDPYAYIVQGTVSGQILQLPDATTLRVGHQFWIINNSTQQVTTQQFGGSNPTVMNPGGSVRYICINNSTQAGIWNTSYSSASSFSGTAPVLAFYGANALVGRYLEIWSGLSSDSGPFISPVASIIVALTLGAESSSTGTVGVFVSTDLVNPVATISLAATTENTITGLNIPLVALAKLSFRVTSGTISKPRFAIYLSAST